MIDFIKKNNNNRNPAKCQVYKQKTEENQKTTFEENLKSVLFKKVMFKKTNLIPLPNFYTSYFTEFFQGNEAIKDIQHSEIVKETIRKSLEEMDRLGGFQIFSDCDSGFGIYSYTFFLFHANKNI